LTRRLALDTNVLVNLHLPVLDHHQAVRRAVMHWLNREGVTLVLTPTVLHEFLHIVTDPRRFDPPVGMSAALAIARGYLGRSTVEWVAPDEACLALALKVMDQEGLGRKRLADCLIGATYQQAGVDALVTLDLGGFRVFPHLRLIDPRDAD